MRSLSIGSVTIDFRVVGCSRFSSLFVGKSLWSCGVNLFLWLSDNDYFSDYLKLNMIWALISLYVLHGPLGEQGWGLLMEPPGDE